MDIYQIAIAAGIGIIVQSIVLAWVISSATRSKDKIELQRVQNKLLVEIALKLGVSKEDVNKALYH